VPDKASWTLQDVLRDHLEPLGVPILADLPFGHGADNIGLPIGRRARLQDGTLSWTMPGEV
jgi:muramoyltetrapeptide carboxypeptidase